MSAGEQAAAAAAHMAATSAATAQAAATALPGQGAAIFNQIIEAALMNNPRTNENRMVTDGCFNRLKAMQEGQKTPQVLLEEQRAINELAMVAAQWVKAQADVIETLKTEISTIKSCIGPKSAKRQNRITESRGAANLKVFSGDKRSSTSGLRS